MKTRILTSIIFSMSIGCSVDPGALKDNQSTQNRNDTKVETPQAQPVNVNKDICSFDKDQNKGCLKAVITNTNLQIGELNYQMGPVEFARNFPDDLVTQGRVTVPDKNTLEFVYPITQSSFFGKFYIAVEGSHTTYAAYNTGMGNLLVNSMSPGFYNVSVFKEFDLKIVNEKNVTKQYVCATIFTQQAVNVVPGTETPMPSSITTFDLKVYKGSCNGVTKISNIVIESEKPADVDTKTDTKIDVKTDTKTDVKTDVKTDTKTNTKTDTKTDTSIPTVVVPETSTVK